MKTALCLVLFLAGVNQAAASAADGKVRGAVVKQATVAPVKITQGNVQANKQDLEEGHIYEVVSPAGAPAELKTEANHVVLIYNPSVIKVRECTPEELSEAKQKFNNVSFTAERKSIQTAYQKSVAGLQKMFCATCPKVRSQASAREIEARKLRDRKLKELRKKEEALLAEALAWADTK